MAWKDTRSLLKKRLNQHGLGGMLDATRVCMKAKELHPGLFEPVSVKNGCMHVEVTPENRLRFTMVQGKLQNELNVFCKSENLPEITRFRLTISSD